MYNLRENVPDTGKRLEILQIAFPAAIPYNKGIRFQTMREAERRIKYERFGTGSGIWHFRL